MVRIKDLTYAYTPGKPINFPEFAIKQGEACLMLGNSGSGKTTLLHLIGGLLRTKNGVIEISNQNINSLSESALDKFRGRNIGFIFQKNHLINALTVKQNLLMAPYLADKSQEEKRCFELLEMLGLSDKIDSRVNQLSHGQAQRVAIARAVVNKPSLILADEPTSALDDTNCDAVIRLLLDVAVKNNATLLIATHDQRLKDKISKRIEL